MGRVWGQYWEEERKEERFRFGLLEFKGLTARHEKCTRHLIMIIICPLSFSSSSSSLRERKGIWNSLLRVINHSKRVGEDEAVLAAGESEGTRKDDDDEEMVVRRASTIDCIVCSPYYFCYILLSLAGNCYRRKQAEEEGH